MKKLLLLYLLSCWTSSIAQELYFLSGKNFTQFSFSELSSSTPIQLQPGSGNYYEVGIANSIEDQPFFIQGLSTYRSIMLLAVMQFLNTLGTVSILGLKFQAIILYSQVVAIVTMKPVGMC